MKHFEGHFKLLKYCYSGLDVKNIFCKKSKINNYFPSADEFKNYKKKNSINYNLI